MSLRSLINRVREPLRAVHGPLTSRDLWGTFWGAFGLGVLLFSYFLVRPIREVQGVRFDPRQLHWLFLATFASMLLMTPLWGMLVRICSRRWLPACLMGVISLSLCGFSHLFRTPSPSAWVSVGFYVWVSVFNYMMVSLYWSVMVDSFSPTVSKRTFGIIAAGGSAGAMLGPMVAGLLARRVSTSSTLLLAAGIFLIVPVCLWAVPSRHESTDAESAPPSDDDDDHSILSGLVETLNTPYLLGIAGYMLLGSVLGSLLYVHQSAAIQSSIADEGIRRQFFATTDLATNILTLVLELLVAAPLLSWGGLRWPLLLLPVIGILAAPLLTLWPTVGAIAAVLVVRRAVEYGLAKPARELLFTVVSRSQKYKAKNFIDTVVARCGDSIGSSVRGVVESYSWPAIASLWIGLPVSLCFGALGVWLSRQQSQRSSPRETA